MSALTKTRHTEVHIQIGKSRYVFDGVPAAKLKPIVVSLKEYRQASTPWRDLNNDKLKWFSRSMEERRDFLEKILSNRVFDYPSVRYELKRPFRILSEMASSSNWLPLVDTL